jgi:hypothetical protein
MDHLLFGGIKDTPALTGIAFIGVAPEVLGDERTH